MEDFRYFCLETSAVNKFSKSDARHLIIIEMKGSQFEGETRLKKWFTEIIRDSLERAATVVIVVGVVDGVVDGVAGVVADGVAGVVADGVAEVVADGVTDVVAGGVTESVGAVNVR